MNAVTRSLQGHLDLVCSLDDLGRSHISRQSFRAPIHLGKPWRDADVLIVNLVNQTAGLLSGDRIAVRIAVETGANLLVTSPSASRAHPTPDGQIALDHYFQIAKGARLEFFPEMFIPHQGTICSQKTTVQIEPGGEFLYLDVLAPGRVAMGESFQYRQLDWRTDIFHGGRLLLRERSKMDPNAENLIALRQKFPHAYYGTIYLLSEPLSGKRDAFLELLALQSDDFWIGLSEMKSVGWIIKVLASNSLEMKRGMSAIRSAIYRFLERPEPFLRKI